MIVLLLQIDTVGLQKAFYDNYLEILRFVSHDPFDLHAWIRNKLAPMMHGLFGADERSIVLDMLERSVVFLTRQNIAAVLMEEQWLSTAWDVANLYLYSLGVS